MSSADYSLILPPSPVPFDESLVGRRLGGGSTRTVYEYGNDGKYVAKRRDSRWGTESNVMEILLWHGIKDTEDAKYVVPLHCWSPDGIWVVMERCTPAEQTEMKPHMWVREPVALNQDHLREMKRALWRWGVGDVHIGNYEILPDRTRMLDYADNSYALNIMDGRSHEQALRAA